MLLCSVALVALGPRSVKAEDDPWFSRDKGLHFGASLGLSAGGYGVSALWFERPAFRALFGFSFALSLGLAKEGWDAAGHGHPSARDVAWDVVGSLTGTAIAWGLDRAVSGMRRRRAKPAVGREPAVAYRASSHELDWVRGFGPRAGALVLEAGLPTWGEKAGTPGSLRRLCLDRQLTVQRSAF